MMPIPILFQGGHRAKRKRLLSVSKGSDLQEADYYDVKSQLSPSLDEQPKLPQTFQEKAGGGHKTQTSIREFDMPLLGNIMMKGQLMAASAMYGCFMTMSGSYSLNADLPENFRVSLLIMYFILMTKLAFASTQNMRYRYKQKFDTLILFYFVRLSSGQFPCYFLTAFLW